ncbi:hypothetical protein DFH29DRAFT_877764 [Suillus ampliporus]|nr:hypothetical protein DFH29DRAFT_877764 [Suillus ampliporus]
MFPHRNPASNVPAVVQDTEVPIIISAQPCDTGIERPLKLAIKELKHGDIVLETVSQLTAGKTPDDIRLDVTKPILHDRSVRWFVKAFKLINKPDIVVKKPPTGYPDDLVLILFFMFFLFYFHYVNPVILIRWINLIVVLAPLIWLSYQIPT